jgi:hypothetical protein
MPLIELVFSNMMKNKKSPRFGRYPLIPVWGEMRTKRPNLIKYKKHLVFFCNQLEINILQGLVEAIEKDDRYSITVIATECIGTTFSRSIKQVEIESRLEAANIQFEKGSKIKLRDFESSIFFTSTPYDIYLPEEFRSEELIKHGVLVNIGYGIRLVKDVGMYAMPPGSNPYLERCEFVFVDEKLKHPTINYTHCGSAKVYFYRKLFASSQCSSTGSKNLKVSWKPRWTQAADSNLFPLLQGFSDFMERNTHVELALIEHPLLRTKLSEVGKLAIFEEWERKIEELGRYESFKSDEGIQKCLNSDVLISDISSTMYEFSFTGNPIIYTTKNIPLNKSGKQLVKIAYNSSSPSEIFRTLIQIKNGSDPLIKKRKRRSTRNLKKLGNPYEKILNTLYTIK